MDFTWIVPLLSLLTLLSVLVFALVSKERIEERRHDPNAPKSTLAKDGPQGGVAFLVPLDQRMRRPLDVPPVLE
ncbi:MAG: hypothetical protein V4804_04655 [Pseudomonadota bacterium]